ncbi:CheR family methyltransferase [Magnetococcales bacterium HHB-1]
MNSTQKENDFQRLKNFIRTHFGVEISPAQQARLHIQLQRRRSALGNISFLTYFNQYLADPRETNEELNAILDTLFAKKSQFFDNPHQFEFLMKSAVPELIKSSGAGISRKMMIWSAGCGEGEEAYTLAMAMSEFRRHYPGFDFKYHILATDMSKKALSGAVNAVYNFEQVRPIPMALKKQYLLKSRNPKKREVRFNPSTRQMVAFRRLNLLSENFGLREKVDILFCRNLLPLFADNLQDTLFEQFAKVLSPGGFLFLDESEKGTNVPSPMHPVTDAIYRLAA